MTIDEHGWPLIRPNVASDPDLRRFLIPGTNITLALRDGSAGFLITHYALWFHECVEPLTLSGPADEWAYSYRPNVNNPSVWSRHAFGLAADLNSTRHPNGVPDTFPVRVRARIRLRLRVVYRGCLRSGIWYRFTKDDMHIEIDKTLSECEKRARALMRSPRGKRILAANPGLDKVIMS